MLDNKFNMFSLLISGLDAATQQTLRMMYAQEKIDNVALKYRERQQLIDDVAEEVISRLYATVDVSEVVAEIEEIQKALEELGK